MTEQTSKLTRTYHVGPPRRTLEEMAQAFGVSYELVRLWENDSAQQTWEQMYAILKNGSAPEWAHEYAREIIRLRWPDVRFEWE